MITESEEETRERSQAQESEIKDLYANCHSYVFTFVSYIEQMQINRNINFCTTKRGVPRPAADGTIEYKLDDPWIVFDNISNSPK